jgi:hypothetical protein
VRLTGRSVNLLVREPSYDVFSEDDLLARGELALALELNPVDRLVVAVEWGYAGGRRSDPLHQDFTAEQQQHSLLLGAWVGYRFWDAVTPFVRGGFAYTWLEGRVRGDGLSMGGWDQAPGGYVFGGLELALARRWMWRALGTAAFTLALTVEAGWVDLGRFAPGGGLDQSALVDEYRDGLGTLELRGAAVSVGFVLSI